MLKFLICLFFVLFTTSVRAEEEDDDSLLEVVKAIMQVQEKRLDITYPKVLPRVSFVEFENEYMLGQYDSITKEIYINDRFIDCNMEYLADHPTVVDAPPFLCDVVLLRDTIAHELGHWYMHEYLLAQGGETWFKKYIEMKPEEFRLVDFLAESILFEGVAEHFGSVFQSYEVRQFYVIDWRANVGAYDFHISCVARYYLYDGGYALVTPILKKRGVDAGIDWILANRLTIVLPGMEEAITYQARGLMQKPAKRTSLIEDDKMLEHSCGFVQ